MIKSLGYLGITTPAYREWEQFGPEILGMELVSPGADGAVRLCMDDVAYRLALHPGEADDVAYVGWDVAHEAAAQEIVDRLAERGITVEQADAGLAAERAAEGLLWFFDPFGFRHELAWGRLSRPGAFRPGRAMSGFNTDGQGMGHVVFFLPDLAAADEFYRNALGFHLSDTIIQGPMTVRFYHVNGRHHTLAIAQAPVVGMHHLMIETCSLDDVGRGYDLCERREVPITQTIGRHTNDRMTSFYLRTPSSFDIEYGWGGITIDDDLWTPRTFERMSLWGHRRPAAAAELPPGIIRAQS